MDVAGLLRLVRRRWLPLALCLLAGAGGSTVVTVTTPPTYRATTRLFVSIPAARGVQEALQGVQLSSQLLLSYSQVATSRTAADRVSAALDRRYSPEQVRARLDVRVRPQTLLLDISAEDTDPGGAQELADTAADTLIAMIAELEPAENAVEARVIDRAARPDAPVEPRPGVNMVVGLALGLGAGLVLAFVLESLDRTLTGSAETVAAFGAPVLAQVPRRRRAGGELVRMDAVADPVSEAYRALRTSLRFLVTARSLRTVLVTSSVEGEGKSTTAANLAVAVSHAGEAVVLVDADLRRSRLADLFGVAPEPGLSEVLAGGVALGDALVEVRTGLHLLPRGSVPPNPAELVGSAAMADLLGRLAGRADLVVLDAPPLLPVTDAAVVAALVDGVVLVTRWGVTERQEAAEARATLEAVGTNVVGVVVNSVPGAGRSGYYRRAGRRRSGAGAR